MPQQFTLDENYNKIISFMKNMNKKHNTNGFGNIYVIKKEDENGNVIDEYFCKNMLTDYGMTQFFINNTSFPTSLYIGNGSGSFNHTTQTLLSLITTNPATVSSSTNSYVYPLYYDKISGLITVVSKYMECYFDYNLTGITSDVSITEYGIGSSSNALWTHSWVYDTSGAQTFITKKQNERLTIIVYMCMSYYESLITNDYANGRYTIITTMNRFFNKMNQDSGLTFKRYNQGTVRPTTNTSSGFMNNRITRYMNFSPIDLYSGISVDSGYIDGFCQWSSGMLTVQRELLPVAESFTGYIIGDDLSDDCISNMFGKNDDKAIPITQASVTSMNMFNHKTNDWTNTEVFTNDNNRWYTETTMATYLSCPIYYTNNNTVLLMYVYQNLQTSDPITAIKTNVDIVYATNKYWDTSSWVLITNFNVIPSEAQTYRYWITSTNTASITPVRQSTGLRVVPTEGISRVYNSFIMTSTKMKVTCDNYQYKWYKYGNEVFATEVGLKYTIGDETNETMTYDRWMVVFNSSTNYLVTDMTSLTTQPTTNTITPSFTSTTVNLYSGCYRTESKTGYICLQDKASNQCVIINLKGSTVTQQVYQSKLACCVWGKDQFVYMSPTDNSINVYDLTSNSVVKTFTLPDGLTPSCIFAHTDYIWITDGSSKTYVVKIADLTSVLCENSVKITSANLNYVKITAVDDTLIIYLYNQRSLSSAYYLTTQVPSKINDLTGLDAIGDGSSNIISYTLRYVNGKTLSLIQSTQYVSPPNYGASNRVYDFGRFIYDKTVSKYTYGSTQLPNLIPFGASCIINTNKKIPLEYFLQHKITGTTRTITTINNIKNIKNEQFSVKFTNISPFSGLPPGNIQ